MQTYNIHCIFLVLAFQNLKLQFYCPFMLINRTSLLANQTIHDLLIIQNKRSDNINDTDLPSILKPNILDLNSSIVFDKQSSTIKYVSAFFNISSAQILNGIGQIRYENGSFNENSTSQSVEELREVSLEIFILEILLVTFAVTLNSICLVCIFL